MNAIIDRAAVVGAWAQLASPFVVYYLLFT
jgi:hypothetical protein